MRIAIVGGFIIAFIIFVAILVCVVEKEKDKSIQQESSETITIKYIGDIEHLNDRYKYRDTNSFYNTRLYIFIYEGHEYLYTENNQGGAGITHKANCKFCTDKSDKSKSQ